MSEGAWQRGMRLHQPTHYEICAEHVAEHASQLARQVRADKLNASAFEGLIDSYLDQPAYRDCRAKLKEIAMRFL
jgi:hypothetical protein